MFWPILRLMLYFNTPWKRQKISFRGYRTFKRMKWNMKEWNVNIDFKLVLACWERSFFSTNKREPSFLFFCFIKPFSCHREMYKTLWIIVFPVFCCDKWGLTTTSQVSYLLLISECCQNKFNNYKVDQVWHLLG